MGLALVLVPSSPHPWQKWHDPQKGRAKRKGRDRMDPCRVTSRTTGREAGSLGCRLGNRGLRMIDRIGSSVSRCLQGNERGWMKGRTCERVSGE